MALSRLCLRAIIDSSYCSVNTLFVTDINNEQPLLPPTQFHPERTVLFCIHQLVTKPSSATQCSNFLTSHDTTLLSLGVGVGINLNLGGIARELVDAGDLELPGRDLVLEQNIELGKSTVLGLWEAEPEVDDEQTAETGVEETSHASPIPISRGQHAWDEGVVDETTLEIVVSMLL